MLPEHTARPESPAQPDRTALRAELATLSTEQVGEQYPDLDALDTAELVAAMNDGNRSVPDAIAAVEPQISAAIDGIVERLRRGGRLIYIGAGTAGRMGILDASEAPPTFGTDPGLIVGIIAGGPGAIQQAVEDAEDHAHVGRSDLEAIGVGPDDCVVGVSASGRTPYVLGAIEYAKSVGALTVGMSCNGGSPLGSGADIGIETVVGPELLTGSTRLKAGTAQKLVLNMLSTISMVRLGKTYRNLMVDLRATNEKLRARSERTVMLATGTDATTASRVLDEVGGWVKAAILVLSTGLSAADAVTTLREGDGSLRTAIEHATGTTPGTGGHVD
ncbi:N-acetylmuramic acid 6-phosphate etherase [Plantibacter sp. YIM 135249]|uniref:N-acetylmuramic acid 6-phosphate etherase n=1 Tax=Plantibacter sp. YIM 135249 TaxID=3423918 RepID=UPI003D34B313